MDYLLKKFKENVGPLLEPLGFKSKGRKFYIRVTEERIYQSVELDKHPPFFYYIKYMAAPLFLGGGIYLSHGGDRLDKAWANHEKSEAWHDWNAASMARAIEDILIPFFEKTKTLEGAYQAEYEGHSMGRNYTLGLYDAHRGECQTVVDEIDRILKLDEEGTKHNIASFRRLKVMTEEEIQEYIKRIDKKREDALQKRAFFTESGPETIKKYFESNEEEFIRVSKWKFE